MAGSLAEVDEDGNEINPRIPQYLSSAPWNLNAEKPSLKHQRKWKQDPSYATTYARLIEGYKARDEARKKYLKEQQLRKLEEKDNKGDEVDEPSDDDDDDELKVDEAKVDESKQMDFA